MKLRQQLLILSLLILSLPWAGCQYVREMERVMLEGQEREMLASARAIALRLAEEPGLFAGADEKTSGASIYFHKLPAAPEIDGYMDEWRGWALMPVAMTPVNAGQTDAQVWVRSGVYGGNFYIHLDIQDASPAFADPTLDVLDSGDYLDIILGDKGSVQIFAGSPGPVVGRYISEREDAQGRDGSDKNDQPDYRITGVWVSGNSRNQRGHQLELQINPSLLDGRVALRYIDQPVQLKGPVSQLELGIERGSEAGEAAFYAIANPALEADLARFATGDLRLGLSDRSGWLLGSAGSIGRTVEHTEAVAESPGGQPGLAAWLYSRILRSDVYAELDNWQAEGQFKTLDVMAALLGQTRTAMYRSSSGNGSRIVRAVFPVQRGGEMLGAVIAEKSSTDVVSATDGAFGRLIFWVILVVLFVSLGLLLYASLLSTRIRRLSRAATEAMEDPTTGNLADDFPVSSVADEIGDLSRNYHELLGRLDEYTLYLKTLSGKLSHELRTPLAIIRSSLDNLEHWQLAEESRVFAERASDGVARLAAIFNAMSSASRLEESIESSEFESVDIGDLLCSVVAGYRDAYPDNAFNLEMPDGACQAQIAPELLVQMLDKLVDNARDFCPEGASIAIDLTVGQTDWVLGVRNPGPLLPEHMKSQIFDSLVSVRTQRAGDAHLGLGLHIVRLIAEHHQAKASADNLPDGSGVRFQVRFPREPLINSVPP